MNFTQIVINNFNNNQLHDPLIPNWLFNDEIRSIVYIRIPYCLKNEHESKKFLIKLTNFTNDRFDFRIIWETKKLRSLFPLKDKVPHTSTVIYEGECSCGAVYIGETNRIVSIRFDEHNDIRKKSEPAKHLFINSTHHFNWRIICSAPSLLRKRKILEAFHIMKKNPSLNNKKDIPTLNLFRHGIT